MASVARLYTPDVLSLATSLARYPLTADLPLRGTARSVSCGSRIEAGLRLDKRQRIAGLGLGVQACAIGQAAAALFAANATGRDREEVTATAEQLASWLAQGGPMPDWPGLDVLAPAAAYPARHGAILLAWRAALDALP